MGGGGVQNGRGGGGRGLVKFYPDKIGKQRYRLAMLNEGHRKWGGSFNTGFKVLTILKSGANGFHPLKKGGGAKSFTLSSGRGGGGGGTKREGGGVGGK